MSAARATKTTTTTTNKRQQADAATCTTKRTYVPQMFNRFIETVDNQARAYGRALPYSLPPTEAENRTRAKAPGTNSKTVLCKFYEDKGKCPFGSKCTYAHGQAELAKRQPRKLETPCWYFNKGGCSKSADDCVYQHVLAPNMRKPLHLQHPCLFFHYRSPRVCRRGDRCGGDHSYELTPQEWTHHFPDVTFPGAGYLTPPPTPAPTPTPPPAPVALAVRQEEFPILGAPEPKQQTVTGGAWGKPLTFKEKPVTKSWGECSEEDDKNFYNQAPSINWWVTDEEPPAPPASPQESSEEELRDKVAKLQTQVAQLNSALSTSKLPAVDGELKSLVTTALKQLLDQ